MSEGNSTAGSAGNWYFLLLGKIFTRYPVLILCLTLTFALSLSWIGIRRHGLPEFGDPYLGFQTRFTPISNRLVTLENFRLEVNRMNLLENYPGERIMERETKRRKKRTSSSMCTHAPLEEHGRVALELRNEASEAVLSRETLSLICYFQKLIREIPEFGHVCEFDERRRCCPMWSVSNYVARYANKSDCLDISTEDANQFNLDLLKCNNFYENSTSNEDCLFRRSTCPQMCHHGQILHSTLHYTVGRSSNPNETKYVIIILPVPKSSKLQTLTESFQEKLWGLRSSLPSKIATVAGFDFGGKDAIFERYLASDLRFVALASVIIFFLVLVFTKSFFVTVISFGMLIFSLGISYYLYKTLFSISYFPFMNMLVTIIILGIGTDATLIVSSAWNRSILSLKCQNEEQRKHRRVRVMTNTLQETTATLFITTCTTAGAFFASLTSSITTIRCFSIFAGTTIITSFFLLYISVPITLDLSERFWGYLTSLFPLTCQSRIITKFWNFSRKMSAGSLEFCIVSKHLRTLIQKLSASSTFWIISFSLCTSLLISSAIFLFWTPGFQLPDTEQFQLLSSSHPVEVFDRLVEPLIGDPVMMHEEKMTIYFIWGIRALDNGNGLDPHSTGNLQFDPEFVLATSENQKWMKNLCEKISKLPFYDPVLNAGMLSLDACFIDTFTRWMKRDCQNFLGKNQSYKPCCNISKFPYENSTFHQCIGLAARDLYRTPSLYFHPDIAGPKFIIKHDAQAENQNENLATFTVRIRTNVSYSLIFEKMDKFYNDVKSSFEELTRDAPEGLKQGFFITSHFDFYDLQKSLMEETWGSLLLSVGLCFIFLWISSRKFSVALGAVVSIFTIVLVTAGLLIKFFNWKLGVFESIAVTVAVGLSDFTAHHALEFSKHKSIGNVTAPTFFAAVSTVIMGLSIYLFSNVLVYEQIGSFFFVLVVISWIYSVFFLTPVLMFLNKVARLGVGTARIVLCAGAREVEKEFSPDEDADSASDLIVENLSVTRVPDKKPRIMMEKWKQLKKVTKETPV